MAVIYECDGCGKKSKDGREIKAATVELKTHTGHGGETYHLCDPCERELRRQADPRKWVRAA